MAKDRKGRLIIAGQNSQPILRVTLKDGKVETIEKLNLPISEAMGLLYAFDSLYINGAGPKGFGLYRCKDTKGNDQYDDVQLLKKFTGGGEHGAHGVALGPDKQDLRHRAATTPTFPRASPPIRRTATTRKTCCCPGSGTATAIAAGRWPRAASCCAPTPTARNGT